MLGKAFGIADRQDMGTVRVGDGRLTLSDRGQGDKQQIGRLWAQCGHTVGLGNAHGPPMDKLVGIQRLQLLAKGIGADDSHLKNLALRPFEPLHITGKTPQKDGLQLQLRFVGIGCRAGTAQAHCQQHAVPPAPQRGQAEH